MTASYINAPRTSPRSDVLARPVAVTEVLECSIEMLEVLREYLFCCAYTLLGTQHQYKSARTSDLVSCRVEHNA